MPDILSIFEQEKRTKSLKRRLEPWREFLVTFYPVLLWAKPWYPAAISSAISTLFLMHWYWNPPIVTSLSLIFMMANLMEFFIPFVCSAICPQQWTGVKEKKYEIICESLVKAQEVVHTQITYVKELKGSHPRMYFMGLISFCSLFAWIGYSVNNWVIGYIVVLLIFLYPGASHNEIVGKTLSSFLSRITDGIRSYKEKDEIKKE